MTIQVGDQYPTWFSGNPSGMSTVLAVLPYTGKFREYFNATLRLSAPNTVRGWCEMAAFIPQEKGED